MELQVVNNKRLLLADKESFVFYHKNRVFLSDHVSNQGKLLFSIPCTPLQRFLSHIPMAERILRLAPRCAEWASAKCMVISLRGHLYSYDFSSNSLKDEFTFPNGMGGPIYLRAVHGLQGFADGIYCGTYIGRDREHDVSIWRRAESGNWTEAYRFPTRRVLHIHNIIPDYDHERMLVLTGDSDEEAGIWEFRSDFSEIKLLAGGNQQYRSCVAFPLKGHIIFATDTPLEKNYLYDYDESSGTVSVLNSMPGPVINGRSIRRADGRELLLMATSVEPDSNLIGIRYFFTRHLGPGVQNRKTHVFCVDVESGIRELCNFKKDIWPMALCQFGNVVFPAGEPDRLFLCPQSVEKYAGKTLEVTE